MALIDAVNYLTIGINALIATDHDVCDCDDGVQSVPSTPT
jgi:hypothetical protein